MLCEFFVYFDHYHGLRKRKSLENSFYGPELRSEQIYRAAGRSRSKAEFIAKIGVVLEEADETVFWLELLRDGDIIEAKRLEGLISEANELAAIFAAAQRTARNHK